MTSTSQVPWRRLITEGAVIVGSILLAFAIDTWWDEYKKNDDVREVLSLVRLETATNLTNIAGSITRHEEIVAAIQVGHENNSIEGFHRDAVIGVEVFEPTTDALQTLISTGMLSSIDDVDLRVAIIAFDGLAKELLEKELAAANLRDAARRRIASLGTRIYRDIPTASPLFTDIEVLNLLTMRAGEEISAINSGRKLESHLQDIARMLDGLSSP